MTEAGLIIPPKLLSDFDEIKEVIQPNNHINQIGLLNVEPFFTVQFVVEYTKVQKGVTDVGCEVVKEKEAPSPKVTEGNIVIPLLSQ